MVHFINTVTFCGKDFRPETRRECFPHGRHIPQWICKERATKSGRKRTAALRVAPNLACGCVARRLQTHCGVCAVLAPRQAKLGATNVIVFVEMDHLSTSLAVSLVSGAGSCFLRDIG